MNKTTSPLLNFVYPCLQNYKKSHCLGIEHKIKKGLFQKFKNSSWFFCIDIFRQHTNRIFNQRGIKNSKPSRILEERECLMTKNKSLLKIDEDINPQSEDHDEKKHKLEKRLKEILTKYKMYQTEEYISPINKDDTIKEHNEQTNIESYDHHYKDQNEKYKYHNTIPHEINYFNDNQQFNHPYNLNDINPTNDIHQINNFNYSPYNNNLNDISTYEKDNEQSLGTFNSTQIHNTNNEQTYFDPLSDEQQIKTFCSEEHENITCYNEAFFRALSDLNQTNNNISQEFKDYIDSYLEQKYHIMTNDELDKMNTYRIDYIKYKTLYEQLIKKSKHIKLYKKLKITFKVIFIMITCVITSVICPTCPVSVICALALSTYLSFF
ncbi:hypothetical protein PFBG_04149 [Plasmodium falciparum 7G8]|uniref:Uncharacterized protein n=5 Tax=Plasmodium falciparum TaxID=5833 RepID=W7JQI5_PLAFO|nr:hypothetical protein PFFVO_03814 [Plasmodium falciparum Vietnam Oak-Knoll (FVO)]ETW60002.1 hypothetical protein PFMC_04178 [Plasmodium falciparum CAMP/Malaysia]EUR67469.1 hypothetical protein PFBG_04149 [Plasmodium falciparum 7G8]EWC87263.1 hypothetical protein PFNF54_04040 [Plasmodium falciparum NF54]KOB87002.1 hypothetical protein PFDG_03039 [Plasmodium falciparum Dd2]